ncbi:ROK family transcriptional regulator [Rhodobacteraceae bacterium CCMM004]|nr:ROK family transcriptional regulator [Rhodobacteraceae bacterium CCMM004]
MGPSYRTGVNQAGVRNHNERLVLTLIHRGGAMPAVDIARRAGLSSQTVSVILRGLEDDGILRREAPLRGQVGKPRVPVALRPDGVLSLGLKIGRRSAELVLMDIAGEVRGRRHLSYDRPMPEPILGFLDQEAETLAASLPQTARERLTGIGIAMPFELWSWPEALGATTAEMEVWRAFDLAAAIAEFTSLPVLIENDGTAAARAEHVFGVDADLVDFAAFFVGTFVGGGLVLNGRVYAGPDGNAGALGSLPVPGGQLIDTASLYLLERALREDGRAPGMLWDPSQDWGMIEDRLVPWIETAAQGLAAGIVSVAAVLDCRRVVIDGSVPQTVRARLVAAVRARLAEGDLRGITPPIVAEGSIGPSAQAIGAAALPIFDRYLLEGPTAHG